MQADLEVEVREDEEHHQAHCGHRLHYRHLGTKTASATLSVRQSASRACLHCLTTLHSLA